MNGGSISNNTLWRSSLSWATPYGGIYLNDSTAHLNNVVFEGNVFGGSDYAYGVAIYVDDSELVAENCTFKGNGYTNSAKGLRTSNSIITIDDGSMEFKNCVFENNGTPGSTIGPDVISVFGGATVKINNSKFLNNVSRYTISCIDGDVEVTESHFEGYTGSIYYSKKNGDGIFKDCNFVGGPAKTGTKSFYLEKNSSLELNTCDLGSSTFNDESRVTFVNCFSTEDGNTLPPIAFGETGHVGSMFGEGSLSMIIALLALITSGVSLFLIVDMKKKLVPATTNNADKTESEE